MMNPPRARTNGAGVPSMSAKLPIGIDDFRALREQGLTYVDKSHFICELIDRPGAQAVLLLRPRRFGKSLALSMLRCYFDRQGPDLGHLFEGLAVARAGERHRAHFRRYPVIQLGCQDLVHARWEAVQWAMREKIRDLFDAHRAVLDIGAPGALERERFGQILDGSAPDGLYRRALLDLSRALHRAHGEKVMLLIDDCDAPVHAGHVHGYQREAADLVRGLLATGLEGNPHLARAVLTGVTGAALSGNLAVYSLLRDEFATCFGFTGSEVDMLVAPGQPDVGGVDARDLGGLLARWYGGHRAGRHDLYSPSSVLSFLADSRARPRPYWLRTGDRDPARHLLARAWPLLAPLLAGESVTWALDDSVPDGLARTRGALYSLLVFCGWLRAVERPAADTSTVTMDEDMHDIESEATRAPEHTLSVPNREVRALLRSMLTDQPGATPDPGPADAEPGSPSLEDIETGPAGAQPSDHLRQDSADIERDSRDDIERGSRDDLLPRHPGRTRRDRDQSRSPRERRPDILADADAFEERLQSFFEEMRATSDVPAGGDSDAPGDEHG